MSAELSLLSGGALHPPWYRGHCSDQRRHAEMNFHCLPLQLILLAHLGSPASFKTSSTKSNLKPKGRQDFIKFYSPFKVNEFQDLCHLCWGISSGNFLGWVLVWVGEQCNLELAAGTVG